MKITTHPLETSALVTVDENEIPATLKGKFVRVRPSLAATDAGLKTYKRKLLEAGALAVRLMPKPHRDQVQLSDKAKLVGALAGAKMELPPVRDLVGKLVDASTSKHKDRVKDLLNSLADKEGL